MPQPDTTLALQTAAAFLRRGVAIQPGSQMADDLVDAADRPVEKSKDGGPAFPQHVAPAFRQEPAIWGMSLRDYFAGQALAGSIANPDSATSTSDTVARDCYHIADAMLAERTKTEGR